ncbi:hypothetical protein ACJIZ3_012681 [Penstemon smallii]|uniref:Uncharacterized protein n=1 Tax=Penstemon smallii TaxID=265156 RepID=A0ABD3UMR8_9LAMI
MGGGAMRAAARVAGITVANGGLRGFTAEHYPVSTVSRRASPRLSEDVKLVVFQPEGGVQKACSEMDDWVFAGEEDATADLMPRVVFGGKSPSLKEATEATSELADALEKAFLSSPNSVGYVENKACITSEITDAPAVPTHAIKAFKFLHESTVAQNVVASIACDPNVWNAVLQNPDLQEFMNSQRKSMTGPNMKEFIEESELHDLSSAKSTDGQFDYEEGEPENGYMDFVEKMKVRVVDMVSSLSDYFQNIFGGQGVNIKFANSEGTAKLSADAAMEASFMGLAVMAIMVILLKRA